MTVSTPLRVSLAIPAYKPTWFRECLESALRQEYPLEEIIIADDCPTTEIRDIVAGYRGDPRIRYARNEPARGLVGNHARLVEQAAGEWLKFLDDDDLLTPDAVAVLADLAQRHAGVVLAFGGVRYIGRNARRPENVYRLPEVLDGRTYFLEKYRRQPITLFTRMLLKKAVVERMDLSGLPPGMISLDELVSLRAMLEGNVAYTRSIIGDYRIHGRGYSENLDPEVLCADLAYILNPYEHAKKTGVIPEKALERWKNAYLRRYARGILIKLLRRREREKARLFWRYLQQRFPGVAARALLSPKIALNVLTGLGPAPIAKAGNPS